MPYHSTLEVSVLSIIHETLYELTGFTSCYLTFIAEIYTINVPDDVTLGGAYDGGGASPASLQYDLFAVGGRLAATVAAKTLVLKAEITALCPLSR